ncbi:hypothetical protein QFC24_007019 [Naganishia onofrii]|uniref:Uncharacterized protein n=1 Tax=Naganishia onofrii TaxID=1851511 RepID=A0ACC2WV47_9TREE|nr:hypothetical protein QFC24_007019 [Naganishia onofrii]
MVNQQSTMAIFHHLNLRVTSMSINLLSYSWGEAITMRALDCISRYARADDKLPFSCLPTATNTSLAILSSAERQQVIANLDACLALAAEENKIAWKKRSRLVQPLSLIKSVHNRLPAGVAAVAEYFSNGADLAVKPARSMATILAQNANRRHSVPKANSAEAEGLNKVVGQMSELLYPGKQVRLFKGKDGLFAIFCETDNSQWFLKKARSVCKERLYRTIVQQGSATGRKLELEDTLPFGSVGLFGQ